jgi:hypothetical protein
MNVGRTLAANWARFAAEAASLAWPAVSPAAPSAKMKAQETGSLRLRRRDMEN